MKTVFGWWDWDAETPALVNRVTGERVAYRGRFQDAELVSSGESWLRFDYLHPELEFPLLVEECPAKRQKDKGKTVWLIDYRRSGDLWKRETGRKCLFPSYGAWRRVDDCVSDAFSCWPGDDAIGRGLASYVRLDGGWLNGVWSKRMRRTETRLSIPKERQPDDEDYNAWLVPLDAPSPIPFEFHDYIPHRPGSETGSIDNPVLLDTLEFEDPKHGFGPKLSPDAVLTELESRTAYLLSKDSRRLLYPYYGDTERKHGSGHWQSWFKALYVDDLVVVSSWAKPTQRSRLGAMWHFSPFGKGLGLRSAEVNPVFFVRSRDVFPPLPSRPLWLQVRWGIADGWCRWDGSGARNSAWLLDLGLVRADGVTLSDGYRGGRWGTPVSSDIKR